MRSRKCTHAQSHTAPHIVTHTHIRSHAHSHIQPHTNSIHIPSHTHIHSQTNTHRHTVSYSHVHLQAHPHTHLEAPSTRLSASALLRVESLSTTPQVACSTESSRQSPAVLFHRGYSWLPNSSKSSPLQLIIGGSTSSSVGGVEG